MKRLTFLFVFNIIALTLFATDDDHPVLVAKGERNINKEALNSFTRTFKNVKAVSWEKYQNLYLANFKLNNEQLTAIYDETGEYISTSRFVEFSELPLSVSMALDNKFDSFQKVGTVVEVSYPNYTVYFFTIETKTKYLRIKSTPDGDLCVTEKMKKPNIK
ncbi:MAG: hypothetical protein ACM3H8_09745 [Sphingobacteriales bacterium]